MESTESIKNTLTAQVQSPEILHFSTGCTLLDLMVGGGVGMGFRAGSIVNLIGDKSAGKSFLKNECIATNHHALGPKNFKFFADDTETGDTFDTEELYGVAIHPENRKLGKSEVTDSETVEELDAKLSMFLDTVGAGQSGIYAVDSLDGLSDASKAVMEQERQKQLVGGKEVKDKGSYGMGMAAFLSQHLFKQKHRPLKDKNVTLLIISQIRDKVNAMGFGQKWEVSGGKALEFYSHTRVFLKTIHKIVRNGLIVGAVVEASTTKSKTPRPFRKCRYVVYFDYGIDEIGSGLDYLFDLRGEDGKLLVAANSVPWEARSTATSTNVQEWLATFEGAPARAKAAKKLQTGNSSMTLVWLLEWIAEDPELSAQYDAKFASGTSREELIEKIEASPKMLAELKARVIEKWEAGEALAQTARKPKFGGV